MCINCSTKSAFAVIFLEMTIAITVASQTHKNRERQNHRYVLMSDQQSIAKEMSTSLSKTDGFDTINKVLIVYSDLHLICMPQAIAFNTRKSLSEGMLSNASKLCSAPAFCHGSNLLEVHI
uniref:Uncharacterized protein n=1 Tax=Rhizophora mucronata TaxID=61149 RepID=A0A2P2P4K5_RHIMU